MPIEAKTGGVNGPAGGGPGGMGPQAGSAGVGAGSDPQPPQFYGKHYKVAVTAGGGTTCPVFTSAQLKVGPFGGVSGWANGWTLNGSVDQNGNLRLVAVAEIVLEGTLSTDGTTGSGAVRFSRVYSSDCQATWAATPD